MKSKEKYIVDENGKRISVIIDYSVYKRMLADLEEFECIKIYDRARSSNDERVPLEVAFKLLSIKDSGC